VFFLQELAKLERELYLGGIQVLEMEVSYQTASLDEDVTLERM